MFSRSFYIFIHIANVLAEPLPQALAGLANVLLGAPGHPTGDGIAHIGSGAVHLTVQVHPVVGCCCFKYFAWLDVRTN